MPTVSVVIPLYHVRDVIRNTIQSVLVQTSKDYEIVVIDDGSHAAIAVWPNVAAKLGDLPQELAVRRQCQRPPCIRQQHWAYRSSRSWDRWNASVWGAQGTNVNVLYK